MPRRETRLRNILRYIFVFGIVKLCEAVSCASERYCQRGSGSLELVDKFNELGQVRFPDYDELDYELDCDGYYANPSTMPGIWAYFCAGGTTFLVSRTNMINLNKSVYNSAFDFDSYTRASKSFFSSRVALKNSLVINLVIKDNDLRYWNEQTIQASNLRDANYVSFEAFNFLRTDDSIERKIPSLNNLKMLSLEGSCLYLLTDLFRWLNNSPLQFLNMRATNIRVVEKDILKSILRNLVEFDLSSAYISQQSLQTLMESLHDPGSERSSHLLVLSLASLNLERVPLYILKRVQYSLKALSLFGNNFGSIIVEEEEEAPTPYPTTSETAEDTSENRTTRTIRLIENQWATFPLMPFLEELDLRNCRIDSIPYGAFDNLENLKKLHISNNNILALRPFAFNGLRNLLVLDMSFNLLRSTRLIITQGITLHNNSFSGLLSLQYLNMTESAISRNSHLRLRNLPPSLIKLSLCRTGLLMLNNDTLAGLNSLKVLDLSYNFALGLEFNSQMFAGLEDLEELYLSGIALDDLSSLNDFKLLKILNVRCNNLVDFGNTLSRFEYLEVLDLSSNSVTSWTENRFNANARLETIYLHDNSLSVLTNAMLEDFKSVKYLSLGSNQLVCNCNLKRFMQYAEVEDFVSTQLGTPAIHTRGNVSTGITFIVDFQRAISHACFDMIQSKKILFTDSKEFCNDEFMRIWLSGLGQAVYITILVTISVSIIGGLIYWKWWYLKYFAISLKNATAFGIINSNKQEEKIYIYDIFVSYSDENRNWVIRELIPNIEGPQSRMSICLHERDFQVGMSILENIITSMDQSRTLLLIISGSFLKSRWCQFEMHLAQHRLLETCREELVLVLLEEIPRHDRPKTLQYLMMTKTYIVWPKNEEDEHAKKLFWRRLGKATSTTRYNLRQWSAS